MLCHACHKISDIFLPLTIDIYRHDREKEKSNSDHENEARSSSENRQRLEKAQKRDGGLLCYDGLQALEDALYLWYTQEHGNGAYISGPRIRKKDPSLKNKLGSDPSFTSSMGWQRRWKTRHSIKFAFPSKKVLEEHATIDSSHQFLLEDNTMTEHLSTQDEEESLNSNEKSILTHIEAREMLKKLITYFKQQSDTFNNDLLTLSHLCDCVSKKYIVTLMGEMDNNFIK